MQHTSSFSGLPGLAGYVECTQHERDDVAPGEVAPAGVPLGPLRSAEVVLMVNGTQHRLGVGAVLLDCLRDHLHLTGS